MPATFRRNSSNTGKRAIRSAGWNGRWFNRTCSSDAGIAEMQNGINAEIDEAIAIAEKDPYPEPEDCLRDVYFEEQ